MLQETLPGSLHTRRPSVSVPLRGRIASEFVSESSFIARGRDFSDRKAVTGQRGMRRSRKSVRNQVTTNLRLEARTRRSKPSISPSRQKRQRPEIKAPERTLEIGSDHLAGGVKSDMQATDVLVRFRARLGPELAVGEVHLG